MRRIGEPVWNPGFRVEWIGIVLQQLTGNGYNCPFRYLDTAPDGSELISSHVRSHDGEGMIFQNYFAFTNQEIGFVYFSNSSNGLSIGEKITEIIIGNYHPSFRWLGIEQHDFQ